MLVVQTLYPLEHPMKAERITFGQVSEGVLLTTHLRFIIQKYA